MKSKNGETAVGQIVAQKYTDLVQKNNSERNHDWCLICYLWPITQLILSEYCDFSKVLK